MANDSKPSEGIPEKAPQLDLGRVYGERVANDLDLIEEVLRRAAISLKVELRESDFDAFCRSRQAKLAIHSQQEANEEFERVRLLNMLYEGCLGFLKEASDFLTSDQKSPADEKIDRADKIIEYLNQTLNRQAGKDISAELSRLYDFARGHLKDAKRDASSEKVMAVHRIIENIYMGYLKVELQRDAEDFLQGRSKGDSSTRETLIFQ